MSALIPLPAGIWLPGRHHLVWLRHLETTCFSLSPWLPSNPGQPLLLPVQFSRPVMSDSLWPHGLQHARLPCPTPTLEVYSNSCPSSRWCHPTISSSVVPFSSHLQSFPASGSFLASQFFASGGQSIGVSASTSVLPKNTQDWPPLGWADWISLQSKGLSRAFSNTSQSYAVCLCGDRRLLDLPWGINSQYI